MANTIDIETAFSVGAAPSVDAADAAPSTSGRSTADPYDSVLEDIATSDGMPERRSRGATVG